MAEYIEREAVLKIIDDNCPQDKGGYNTEEEIGAGVACCYIRKAVENIPTDDVAEVVRCKDCKFWTPMDNGISWQNEGRTDGECQFLWQRHHAERHLTEKDHFCGYGERKE